MGQNSFGLTGAVAARNHHRSRACDRPLRGRGTLVAKFQRRAVLSLSCAKVAACRANQAVSKAAAEHIGSVVGVDEVIPEVLPEEKALHVQKLEAEGRRVMMVGDGINDAPALTAATVGCAIGSGSDIAIESADIVLMRSDLEDVPRALRLSALTLRDIKQNLFWAFCYNTVGIPIAAGLLYAFGGPLLSPMFAGAAMSLSSVCVVGNALRLGTVKL